MGRDPHALAPLLGLKRLPTLMWAMPAYGAINTKVYRSHLAAMGNIAKLGIRVIPTYVGVSNKMNLSTASNTLVHNALDAGVDYVFWTEMDMDLPPDALPRLLDRNLPIVSGLYFLRGTKHKPQPCAYLKYHGAAASKYSFVPIAMLPERELLRVDACGMGCVLFKTEIFRKLEEPFFDDREKECGQDMYFYSKVYAAGIPVWLDTHVCCDQLDESEPEIIGIEDYRRFIRHGNAGAASAVTNGFIYGTGAHRDYPERHL